jgi:ABC-type multidrug transport system fused ATPase/permease subunit
MMGLVMQEHTLFNYNITENILYEKMEATNTELREAAKVANALEFIENDQLSIFEDEAEALIGYMEQY